MDAHTLVKGYFIGLMALGMVANIVFVGKERKPITPELAAFNAVWVAGHILLVYNYL